MQLVLRGPKYAKKRSPTKSCSNENYQNSLQEWLYWIVSTDNVVYKSFFCEQICALFIVSFIYVAPIANYSEVTNKAETGGRKLPLNLTPFSQSWNVPRYYLFTQTVNISVELSDVDALSSLPACRQ